MRPRRRRPGSTSACSGSTCSPWGRGWVAWCGCCWGPRTEPRSSGSRRGQRLASPGPRGAALAVGTGSGQPSLPAGVVATGHDFATTTRVRLTVTPGTVGPNRFVATVVDYDTGRPASATGVTLTFALPGHPELGSPTLPLHR